MHRPFSSFFVGLLALGIAGASPVEKRHVVQPYTVDLSGNVARMLQLIRDTKLPDKPEYPGVGSSFGIDLDVLKGLQTQWLNNFDWQKEQNSINE
jgi:hypothetical protein